MQVEQLTKEQKRQVRKLAVVKSARCRIRGIAPLWLRKIGAPAQIDDPKKLIDWIRGDPAYHVTGFKHALVSAAGEIAGETKTFIRGAVLIESRDDGLNQILKPSKPIIVHHEVTIRKKLSRLDVLQIKKWEMDFDLRYSDQLATGKLVELIEYAGMKIGLGLARPSRGGTNGTFELVSFS